MAQTSTLGLGLPGSLAPQSVLSRARPRTGPTARTPRASSSLGTAGDSRADAQTDRRRGAGRSPAAPGVCESKEEPTPPFNLSPCSARSPGAPRGALTGGHRNQSPQAGWGPFPEALVRAYAPSPHFKQGTFICPWTMANFMQNHLFKCVFFSFFFFFFWCGEGTLLKSASQ